MTSSSSDNGCSGGGIFSSSANSSVFTSADNGGGGIFVSPYPPTRNHNHRCNHPTQGGFFSMSRSDGYQSHDIESGPLESQPRSESGPRRDFTISEESESLKQPPPAYSPRRPDGAVGGNGLSQPTQTQGTRTPSPMPKPVFKQANNRNAQQSQKMLCLIATFFLVFAVVGIIVAVIITHAPSPGRSNLPPTTFPTSSTSSGPDSAAPAGPADPQMSNGSL